MERLLYSASAQSRPILQVAVSESGGYGPIDHAGLPLITCGGTYDAAGHSYLDNVVVFARRKAVPGPGWLTTRRGQLITTTKGLDVRPESGSSTRSR